MTQPLMVWWLVIQLCGLAGLPIGRFLFRALPDHGYAFAKALGLLLVGYLAWLLAMLGLASFSRGLLVICLIVVAALGLMLLRGPAALLEIGAWFRQHWRLVLGYEVLFLIALLFVALLRSYNPHPWGTERAMDFALFNAIRISSSFPPHDPWLAGYSINYYYFGYLLMAAMALLSGVEPSVGYNLSLALVFALAALGLAGIVYNLISLTVARSSGALKAAAIALTVVLVLVAGNQAGALEVITGHEISVALKGQQLRAAISNGLGERQTLLLDPPFKGWDFNETAQITPRDMWADFNWWWPSRVVWDDYAHPDDPQAQPERRYTITEFPFFSFWLGDMHPHVMSLPFVLLAVALALQTTVRPSAPPFLMGWRGKAELALTGIVLGSLYAINSWDFPTILLLFLGALLLLHIRLASPASMPPAVLNESVAADDDEANDAQPEPVAPAVASASPFAGVRWRLFANHGILAVLASILMLIPFYLTFHSLVGDKEPLINLPILATLTSTLGIVVSSRTSLLSFLFIFGLFLLPLLTMLFTYSLRHDLHISLNERLVSLLLIAGSLLIGLVLGFPLLALLPLAIYAILLAAERTEQPALAFVLWGFALVCLVCFGTEVVYIRDGFEGASSRMNTIFKFYYQAWLLWGVLAGYALWWLADRLLSGPRALWRWLSGGLFAVLFVALLAGALIYPWLTAGKTFREGQRVGLVGKTPRENTSGGEASIAWLRANAPGDAVILEAVGGSYSPEGYASISAATGLATVLGWPGHESQWRGGHPEALAQIGPRQQDVQTIYSTTDVNEAHSLLQRYKVRYVYLGPLEYNSLMQSPSPQAALDKFGSLGQIVFQQGDVTIYQINE
jgi:YYY domain-containing protein